MYERFTDRARKVLQLANQEAQRFNHEYIDSSHILLGIVKEGAGVASTVLKNRDVDLRKIRLEIEKLIQPGPDMVTVGKLPQTPAARKVIERAINAARSLRNGWVGTEHLLLGLIADETIAGNVLASMGVKADDVRADLLLMIGTKSETAAPPDLLTELRAARDTLDKAIALLSVGPVGFVHTTTVTVTLPG
jgi:ATP-dependent Clp protease ATP-binding subunit ClpC